MVDIFSIKKAYLVGIKGVGMTALASILKKLKVQIVGSDIKEKFFTDNVLKKHKIKYYENFDKKNLIKELPVDLIISSLAYLPYSLQKTNNRQPINISSSIPEINLAHKLNIPIITYPQALATIFNQSFGIAICGSHGKSSTTAILGHIFKKAGLTPNVVVGSEVIEWQSNSLVDKNLKNKIDFLNKNKDKISNIDFIRKNIKKLPLFIIEADEYRESFLNYYPKIIIITNIDYDHPDYFKNKEKYNLAFKKFINNATPPKIIISHRNKNKFLKKRKNEKIKKFPFPIPGKHFQKNLQLLYALTKIIRISLNDFINAIKTYKGIKRRFEIIKNLTYKDKKIIFIDDYAHHPTEILSFYKSLTEKYPDYFKYLVFQPHTYSRTHYLFRSFKKTFIEIKKDNLVKIIFFKTFPSARESKNLLKIKKIYTINNLAKAIDIAYFATYQSLTKFIKKDIFKNKNKKIIISAIGAGNIYNLFSEIKF